MIEIDNELYEAVQALGKDVVIELARGLVRARMLHPVFAESARHAADVVHEEARELVAAALGGESPDRQHAEALDTVVTGLRFMGMEWLPKFGAETPPRASQSELLDFVSEVEREVLEGTFEPKVDKEFYNCPSCGYELDTGWECGSCGADWQEEATRKKGLNPSEAVYGFAAWLTTRDDVVTMSARHDCGVVADLVREFCAVQGLPPITAKWPDNLKPHADPVGIGTPPSDDGYDCLRAVLDQAVEQASRGKGRERHASGEPFDQQTILQTTRAHGLGFATGQAEKKLREAHRLMGMELGGKSRAVRELLGAINYTAAAILRLQEAR